MPVPLGTAAPSTGSTGPYAFEQRQGTGAAVAYDPCRPLHYVVDPAGAPADGAALIADAIAAVGRATGPVLVDDGTTAET